MLQRQIDLSNFGEIIEELKLYLYSAKGQLKLVDFSKTDFSQLSPEHIQLLFKELSAVPESPLLIRFNLCKFDEKTILQFKAFSEGLKSTKNIEQLEFQCSISESCQKEKPELFFSYLSQVISGIEESKIKRLILDNFNVTPEIFRARLIKHSIKNTALVLLDGLALKPPYTPQFFSKSNEPQAASNDNGHKSKLPPPLDVQKKSGRDPSR